MKTLTLKGYFTGFGPRKDKSASIRFTTQEVEPKDFQTFAELVDTYGEITFRQESEEKVGEDNN